MRNLLLVAVALVLGVSTLSAKTISEDVKAEISKHMVYPTLAQEQMIEGEVWIKVAMDENKEVKIVEISSTNAALRTIVQDQVANISIENTDIQMNEVVIMKFKYDLLN